MSSDPQAAPVGQPRVLLNRESVPSRFCLGQDFLNGGPPYPLFQRPVDAPTAEREDAPGVAVRPQGGWVWAGSEPPGRAASVGPPPPTPPHWLQHVAPIVRDSSASFRWPRSRFEFSVFWESFL